MSSFKFKLILLLLLSATVVDGEFLPDTDLEVEARETPKIIVKGHVLCDRCSHRYIGEMSVPLHDAEVGVKCLDLYGLVTFSGVGYTNIHGVFSIPMDDIPPILGIRGCTAKLLRPPNPSLAASSCDVITSMGNGHLGAPLRLMHKSVTEVVFTAGPFACRPSELPQICYLNTAPPPQMHSPPPPLIQPPPPPPVYSHPAPPVLHHSQSRPPPPPKSSPSPPTPWVFGVKSGKSRVNASKLPEDDMTD